MLVIVFQSDHVLLVHDHGCLILARYVYLSRAVQVLTGFVSCRTSNLYLYPAAVILIAQIVVLHHCTCYLLMSASMSVCRQLKSIDDSLHCLLINLSVSLVTCQL